MKGRACLWFEGDCNKLLIFPAWGRDFGAGRLLIGASRHLLPAGEKRQQAAKSECDCR